MQRLRALATLRQPLSKLRSTLSTTHYSSVRGDRPQDEVLVEGKASARAAILNPPSVLNALNTNKAIRLNNLYQSWKGNPDIGFATMKGSGRAFCAGGDVVALYRLLHEGKVEDCKEFFRNLYKFIYTVLFKATCGYFGWRHDWGWGWDLS